MTLKEREHLFFEKANKVHGDKYDYSKVDYISSYDKVTIICTDHGEFDQLPGNHLEHGCPKCKTHKKNPIKKEYKINLPKREKDIEKPSNFEGEIRKFVESFGIKTDKYEDDAYTISLYIPELKLGIECNDIETHSHNHPDGKPYRNWHKNKSLYFAERGISLVRIWEDQYMYKKDLTLDFIQNKIGKASRIVYARECEVRKVSFNDIKDFLERNHFQGKKSATLYYGLYHNGELVQVMTFVYQKKKEYWEIDRFAVDRSTSVVGGASKLFKQFLNDENPDVVFTYSSIDVNNLPEKSVYNKMGFELEDPSTTDPSYFYFDKDFNRIPRIHFQKFKLLNMFGDKYKDMTEFEITDNLGYFRVFDSGNYRWKYVSNQ